MHVKLKCYLFFSQQLLTILVSLAASNVNLQFILIHFGSLRADSTVSEEERKGEESSL